MVLKLKLKYHQKKLLKKVDFVNWKIDDYNKSVVKVMRTYKVTRNEYNAYWNLVREIRVICEKVENYKGPYTKFAGLQLSQKLYDMGLVESNDQFYLCCTLKTVDFCRRRLSSVLQSLKMADSIEDAVKYIEQGHVRIGPDCVRDPAMIVTRKMQDFVTWTEASSIKREVHQYNDTQDDFDLAE